MARIFLSHSSADEVEAVALKQWLADNGWDDVFLDLDPVRGLAAGERWQEALRQAADRCEAVVFLVSPSWAKSRWCLAEFLLAKTLHKLIFGVTIKDVPFAELPGEMTVEWQLCRLTGTGVTERIPFRHLDTDAAVEFLAEGLGRLKLGLQKAGLGAVHFPWPPADDPKRSPFRGLEPLDVQDAAVFFGREVEILRGLDALRGLRDNPAERLFVILGASGTGKSSFLRAGLLPRLARDDRHFLPLPVVRPETTPISGGRGLGQALAQTLHRLGLPESAPGHVKARLNSGVGEFVSILRSIQEAAGARLVGSSGEPTPPPPTLVLPVDQAEELFNADAGPEASQFLSLVASVQRPGDATATPLSLIVAFTIRSDRYEPLQTARELAGLQAEVFDDLKPMPADRFREVITGPIQRASGGADRLEIEPELVNQLVQDCATGADTLPLLGFTLERLYRDFGGSGHLRLEDYKTLGGIQKIVETRIESVLERDAKQREAQLALLRRAFIPALVTINPQNDQPMRRVARRADLPAESLPLLDALVENRLLLRDQRHGEDVVEIAHEALLRQWELFAVWLREELVALKEADALERDARDWRDRKQDESRLWRGQRLRDATTLSARPDFQKRLQPCAVFLARCQEMERERLDKEARAREEKLKAAEALAAEQKARAEEQTIAARRARRLTRIAAAVTALAMVIAFFAFKFWDRGAKALRETQRQLEHAQIEEGKAWVERAKLNLSRGDNFAAAMMAGRAIGYVGYGRERFAGTPLVSNLPVLLTPSNAPADEASAQTALASALERLKEAGGRPIWQSPIRKHHSGPVSAVAFSPDGTTVASGSRDKTVKLWEASSGKELATFRGHAHDVTSVAFSPDGKTVASGSGDKTVKLWEAGSGKELATFRGHADSVNGVAFSPDGKTVASGSSDETVKLWEPDSGKDLATFRGHAGRVFSVAFNPDGKTVASGSEDKTVKLWEAGTGKELLTFRGHATSVFSVAFSPDGKTVASGSEDDTVRLWEVGSGKELATFLRHGSKVAFSPDGKTVASGSSTGETAKLWEAGSGEVLADLRGHAGRVFSLAFSPDGNTVASGSEDNTVKLWEAGSGKELATFRGHAAGVSVVAFSPDGKTVASASRDTTVKLWEAGSGQELATFRGHAGRVSGMAFSPDGRTLALGSEDVGVKLCEVGTGKVMATFRGHAGSVNKAVAFSPDGKTVASGSADMTVKVWEVPSGKLLATCRGHAGSVNRAVAFSPDGKTVASGSEDKTVKLWEAGSGKELATFRGHTDSVSGVTFSPDGKTVASASWDTTVKLWEAGSGKELATFRGHAAGVSGVAFSPDGKTVASASWDNTVRLWEAGRRRELATCWGHATSVWSVAFSPDGKTVASASWDKTVKLWEAGSGTLLATFRGHLDWVTSVAFSPDGKTLASGSRDATVRLWEAGSGKELATFHGHRSGVWSVAFSPDGKTVATGSRERAVRLWEAGSGKELATFHGHTDDVLNVAFSPDGKTVASGSADKTVKLWEVPSGKLLATCRGHGREVTSVAFSPNGKTVASASADYQAKLWEVPSGKELITFNGARVWSVAFSPDGKTAASGSLDRTVTLWEAGSGKVLATFSGHRDRVTSVGFSPDGKTVASGSDDGEVMLWEADIVGQSNLAEYMQRWVRFEGSELVWLDTTDNLFKEREFPVLDPPPGSLVALCGRGLPETQSRTNCLEIFLRSRNWPAARRAWREIGAAGSPPQSARQSYVFALAAAAAADVDAPIVWRAEWLTREVLTNCTAEALQSPSVSLATLHLARELNTTQEPTLTSLRDEYLARFRAIAPSNWQEALAHQPTTDSAAPDGDQRE